MKGKALRQHSLHEKTAVLLKPFISGTERCHTNSILKCKQHAMFVYCLVDKL